MLLFRRHLISVVVFAAMLFTTPSFVAEFMYCVEYFELEDGSICSMAMDDKDAGEVPDGILSLESSNSCCASKSIEANKRTPALVKEFNQKDKAPVAAIFPSQDFPLTKTPEDTKQADNRHSHSPPLSQLIVQSSVLLI